MSGLAIDAAPADGASAGQKFGTFLGVYTPSVLTILGVIMYQRFGRVVGYAGLGGAIGVVLLAHVISVTTGLSVASIATNHTVKTGGNYYIISRSLGLSIGGAIGLALYVALALGVSLYLIGFGEAFIAATGWSPTGSKIDDLRLIGTVANIALALLTLWSTSIALKSQLFVLAAIILSIISMVLGTPIPPIEGELAVALAAPAEAPPFATVFAIFFPAVTGFTAGVGMSGDLKDPKRAIPVGTIGAIVTGMVIYLALPFLFANQASVQQLQLDENILLRTSWVPELVTAGVFAATLSSALGSLLGAPRTLQALAFDRIVPKFLGRGREEPRIALVVTLVIAEAGILVGELELIGAVLSMFFLTCYGFLCLACGLERWASPDFRPQFKVPVWVSLLGAASCFLVMFQINALAMFGAIFIMAIIYAVLKRRQLVLSSGDTWGGVWSAVVRAGLLGLRQSNSAAVTRNWRPNMVVLSREHRRREMIGFARSIVGDRGILTHFNLVPGAPRRARIDRALEAEYPGLFARTQGCDDPYETIPTLVASFGLVGMETNVVLLGWPRGATGRVAYADMIGKLLELDVSVLMLRFDEVRGFGKCERIDVWWDGESPTGPLMLTLAHMIQTSQDWKNSKVRVLVNGQRGADEADAKKRLDAMIEDERVTAEGVLLAPLSEEGSLADRIRQESQHADLVIVHAAEGSEENFVERNDAVLNSLGTALLVRPAEIFSAAPVIFEEAKTSTIETTDAFDVLDVAEPTIAELEPLVRRMLDQLTEAADRFAEKVQTPSVAEERQLIDDVVREARQIPQLERRLTRRGGRREAARGLVDWAKSRYATAVMERTRPLRDGTAGRDAPWAKRVREGIGRLRADVSAAVAELPEWTSIPTERVDWEPKKDDAFGTRLSKFWVRIGMRWFNRRPPARRVPVRQVVAHHLGAPLLEELERSVLKIGVRRFDAIRRTRRLSYDTERFFANLLAELDLSPEMKLDITAFRDLVARDMVSLLDVAEGVRERYDGANDVSLGTTRTIMARAAQHAVTDLEREDVLELAEGWSTSKDQRAARRVSQSLEDLPAIFKHQHDSIVSALELDLHVASLTIDARRALYQVFQRVRREIEQGPVAAIDRAEEIIRRVIELREQAEEAAEADEAAEAEQEEAATTEPAPAADLDAAFVAAADDLRGTWDKRYRPEPRELFDNLLAALGRAAEKVPPSITTMSERSLDAAAEGSLDRTEVVYPARRLAQAFLEKKLAEPARSVLADLPKCVHDAQDALVDAVRLVAFELEQVATAADDDPDAEGPSALGGILEERLARLDGAKADLVAYVTELRRVMLEEGARSLESARTAIVSGDVSLAGPAPRTLRRRAIAERASKVITVARGRVGKTVDKLSEKRRTTPGSPGTITDELLELRERLAPRADVQTNLPLIYRRLFGRAPLENSDLLRGRVEEMAHVARLVDRWSGTASGPIAIVGPPRSGRTSIANIVGRELLSDRNVVRIAPPPGGDASSDAVNAAVAKAVGAREGQGAEGALRGMPPGAVVVVDELGHWIERSVGGTAALQLWMRLFRRLGDRHLFVLTATDFAWSYANELAGIEGSFLGTVVLRPLFRPSIEAAIRLRQHTSEMGLAMAGRGRWRIRSFVERRQFGRLYDQSAGNVGEAIDLWRRSIVDCSERNVSVSVAAAPDVSVLDRLPLRWYAALANVALHRAVTAQRMSRIGRMSREEATGLLADLERGGLLVSDKNGAWTLDPTMQRLVLEALRRRGVLT